MKQVFRRKTLLLTGMVMALTWALSSCDLYSSGEQTIGEPDKTICGLFADSVFTNVSTVAPADVNSSWENSALNTFAAQMLDSLVRDTLIVGQGHAPAYKVFLSADTTYLAVKANGGAAILFTTNVVDWTFFKNDLSAYTIENDVMPGATISGCISGDDKKADPVIKMRQEYTLDAGNILVRIVKTDQTLGSALRVVVQ